MLIYGSLRSFFYYLYEVEWTLTKVQYYHRKNEIKAIAPDQAGIGNPIGEHDFLLVYWFKRWLAKFLDICKT